jgi:murein L,D-transpeptidase YcbB/YkuD
LGFGGMHMHGRSFVAVIAAAVPALVFAVSVQVEAYAEDAATEREEFAPPLPTRSPAPRPGEPRVIAVPTVEVPAPAVHAQEAKSAQASGVTAQPSTLGPADTEAPAESGTPTPATDVSAAPPSPVPADAVVEAIRAKLAGPALAGAAATEDLAGLQAFYAERSEPVWITPMGFTARAQGAIDEIGKADDWGLAAAAFTLPPAGDLTDQVDEQADAEIKLALVVLKYARHARGGRVDPASVSRLLDQQPPLKDPKTVLVEIAAADEPDAYLRGLHPKHDQFQRLQQALVKVRNPGEDGQSKKTSERDIQRILVNMERWRWMPEDLGPFYVQDNVPEFMLYVVKDGKTVHADKIVVGQLRYATPIFSADMRTLVFNPEWTVPPTIVREDLLPKLRGGGGGWFGGGSSILKQHGLKVRYNGKIVDPGSINWGSVNMASIAFVQAPGPTNVLGKLKFLYPNKHIVYMHDTIKPNLFKTAVRAEGHNCIRMEKPGRLAEIMLAHDKGWDAKKIQDLLAKGYNAAVGLDRPFPVHTTYFTAAVDENGELKTFGDVYGLDAKVVDAVLGKSVTSAPPEVTSSVPQPAVAAAPQPQPKKKEAAAETLFDMSR